MSDLQLRIDVLEARGIQRRDANGLSDPYVVAKFRGLGKMMNSVQTSIVHNTLNPVWNQELTLYPKSNNDILLLKVYDHDALGKDNLLGMVEVPISNYFQHGFQDLWVQLMQKKGSWKSFVGGQPTWLSTPGQLHFRMWFGLSSSFAAQAMPQQNMMGQQVMPQQNMGQTGFVQTGYGQQSGPMMGQQTGFMQGQQTNQMMGQTGLTGQQAAYATPVVVTSTPVLMTTPMMTTGYTTQTMPTQPYGAQYAAQHAKGLMVTETQQTQTFNSGFQPLGSMGMTNAPNNSGYSAPPALTSTSGFQPVL